MNDRKNINEMSLQELVDSSIEKMKDILPTEPRPDEPDIARDLMGNPYNAKYPPNYDLYGHTYDGYKSWNQSAFFLSFVVEYYDLEFSYKGKTYYIGFDEGKACFFRTPFDDPYLNYPSGNELLEQFTIEGTPLINLIDELEDVDVF